jgi:hypothetical protein
MRKFTFLVVFAVFTSSIYSQVYRDEWALIVGVNAINSLGTRSPINSPDEWSFRYPISAAAEFNWGNNFTIEPSFTFNGFTEKNTIDGATLTKDYNYISFDTHVKYYFGRYILPETDWINFYANAGLGLFHIDKTNVSANLGGGVLFWLNEKQTFGLRAQTIGKFAFDHPDSGFDNNHFQYHLQAVIIL